MRTRSSMLLATSLCLLLAGCSGGDDSRQAEGVVDAASSNQDAGGTDLPATVEAAARKAVEGLVIDSFKSKQGDDELLYDIEGHTDEQGYAIQVTADGRVRAVQLSSSYPEEEAQDEDGYDDE